MGLYMWTPKLMLLKLNKHEERQQCSSNKLSKVKKRGKAPSLLRVSKANNLSLFLLKLKRKKNECVCKMKIMTT